MMAYNVLKNKRRDIKIDKTIIGMIILILSCNAVTNVIDYDSHDKNIQRQHGEYIFYLHSGAIDQNAYLWYVENKECLSLLVGGVLAHTGKKPNTPAKPGQSTSEGNIACPSEKNRNRKGRIIKKFLVQVFVLTLECVQYLKEGPVNDLIRKEFNDRGFSLSRKAKIVEGDDRWFINSSNQTYCLNEKDKQLEVCRLFHGAKKCRGFLLTTIGKKLNKINIKIRGTYPEQFPKDRSRMKSFYEYKRRQIVINQKGKVKGGELHVLMSLVDFTFIRSLVSGCYSRKGGHCHDPVTVFLLDLFAHYEKKDPKNFVKFLKNNSSACQYRKYAGLPDDEKITDATIGNLRRRIGEEKYNQIFSIMVQIMTELGFITGEILTTDGTLVPTYSRYKGCTYACEGCKHIKCKAVSQKIKERIEEICSDQKSTRIGKENRIFVECSNPDAKADRYQKYLFVWDDVIGNTVRFRNYLQNNLKITWAKSAEIKKDEDGKTISLTNGETLIRFKINEKEDGAILEIDDKKRCEYILKKKKGKLRVYKKRLSLEVVSFRLENGKDKSNKAGDKLARDIGIENMLAEQNSGLNVTRSNIVEFDSDKASAFVKCPRIPSDIDAGMGCRRSKDNPNKKEWVFGFNVIITTAINPLTGLELPVAVVTIPGNGNEGGTFPELLRQADTYSFKTGVHLADGRYDTVDNYREIREMGGKPLIGYNPRKENLSEEAKRDRGYDENGCPYADCEVLMTPNGFDSKLKRVKFCCFHKGPENLSKSKCTQCKHFKNKTGQVKNMSIKKHPRLILEIPRGTKKYKKTYNNRTASERINSYVKDNYGLRRPLIRGLKNFKIKALIACTLALLIKVIAFILEKNILPTRLKCECISQNRKIKSHANMGDTKKEGDSPP